MSKGITFEHNISEMELIVQLEFRKQNYVSAIKALKLSFIFCCKPIEAYLQTSTSIEYKKSLSRN